MGVKQREWAIFVRPHYRVVKDGVSQRLYHTLSNEDTYLGDRRPVEREVSYTCDGYRYYRSYWMPAFVDRVETRYFTYWCNDRSYNISYCYPIFNPSKELKLESGEHEDGLWTLHFKTTSYIYLMEELQKMHEDIELDIDHIKVAELFDVDIERLMLTWDGGGKDEVN